MRLKAFVAGVVLNLFVLGPLVLLLDSESSLVMPAMIITYGISGVILGYLLVNADWRLGLWLVAFSFLMLPFHILFADPVNWDWNRELKGLLAHALIVVAACLGTEIGAIIKRNRLKSR
ncbi:MAG: hypothetical protein H0U96_04955 [Acidobacteria bacterium]|jgi:hypothetical protein|nr:hypothetical protein [Acidobacteriota bacterium]